MSEETVQEVIIKAVSDPEFRELLFSDPDKALDGYELTEEEVESLKHVDRDSFEENLSELEERVSRAGLNLGSYSESIQAKQNVSPPPEEFNPFKLIAQSILKRNPK